MNMGIDKSKESVMSQLRGDLAPYLALLPPNRPGEDVLPDEPFPLGQVFRGPGWVRVAVAMAILVLQRREWVA